MVAGDGRHSLTDEVLSVWQAPRAALPPQKIANFLHEFRGNVFPSLGLPPLPSDHTRLDVHAMLWPLNIGRWLRRLTVIITCRNT